VSEYETPEYPDHCYCSSNGECRRCIELWEEIETNLEKEIENENGK
jgi:hypothetical protein